MGGELKRLGNYVRPNVLSICVDMGKCEGSERDHQISIDTKQITLGNIHVHRNFLLSFFPDHIHLYNVQHHLNTSYSNTNTLVGNTDTCHLDPSTLRATVIKQVDTRYP